MVKRFYFRLVLPIEPIGSQSLCSSGQGEADSVYLSAFGNCSATGPAKEKGEATCQKE